MTRSTIDVPLRQVTLLEDRATTRRSGQVEVVEGRNRFRIEDVSPVVVDSTLLVRIVEARGELKVSPVDSRVIRRRRVRQQDLEQKARELNEAKWAASDERDAIGSRISHTSQELEMEMGTLRERSKEISEDVALGRVEDWSQVYSGADERVRALRARLAELHRELKKAEQHLADLDIRDRVESDPSSAWQCSIEFELDSSGAGTVDLSIDVVVPCACWRPQHRATLQDGRLRFESDACVWQNTGEAWDDVQIVVSTERASLGASPPSLSTDWLSTQKKDAGVQVEVREQAIETTGMEGQAGPSAAEVPGVDDGGQPWLMKAEQTTSVPSDGRPHRVPLGAFECEADVSRMVRAERVAAVIVRVMAVNESAASLLAGPVDLVRDSGPIGRTEVAFVAPGQKFELGFGADPELRVKRTTAVFPSDKALLSGKTTTPHKVTLFISNLGTEPRALQIAERIPVSEVSAVQVEVDEKETTAAARPDRDGIVVWKQTIAARGQLEIKLRYELTKSRDVVGL